MSERLSPLLLALALLVSGCASSTRAQAEPQPDQPNAPVVAQQAAATDTAQPAASATAAAATRTVAPSATRTSTRRPTRTASATSVPTDTVTPPPTATATRPPTNTPPPAPTATPTANASGEIVHTVGIGETLLSIATQYGVLRSQLMAYNEIGAEVTVGQAIRIPVGMMDQNYNANGGRGAATPLPSAANESRVVLGPVTFDWQKLNNCGPTTTSVLLSYFGIAQPQGTIAGALKPNPNDKNVSPSEVAAYVRRQGLGAFVGINGDIALLERLLAAGYPVMVEQWMSYDGGVGHYRAVRGYDRDQQKVLYEDTFLGPQIWRAYGEFNRDWAYFNNTYIVYYPAADEGKVAAIIGGDWNRAAMWERALATFSAGSGALALYGRAEALHQLGRSGEAIPVFEQAIAAGLPSRYLWYRFGYFEALNNQGLYQRTLDVTAPVLVAMGLSEDIRYHRAVAYRALGQTEQARRELQLALQDNPNYGPASSLLAQLPPPPAPPTWTATPAALPSPTPDPALFTPTPDPAQATPTPDPALWTPTAEPPPPPPPEPPTATPDPALWTPTPEPLPPPPPEPPTATPGA